MHELIIGTRRIADDTPSWVCAEVANNHGGNVDLCKAMFKAAADAGCAAVKLQKRDNAHLYTPAMLAMSYNNENSFGTTYGEHRVAQEFDFEQYRELKVYAESLGLIFFATAFDTASVDFLIALGVWVIKIASGDLQNIPLIRYAASKGLPLIISTGGGTLDDVERVYEALTSFGIGQSQTSEFAFLQCTAEYPVHYEDVNLRVIETYRERFPNTVIGFSSHEDGIDLAVPAYMLGARIHEQHFTTNHTLKGSDNPWSLEPDGMKRMIRSLARAHIAIGDGVKQRYEAEEGPLYKMSKGIYPTEYFPTGHILQAGDLQLCSPGDGLPAWKLDKFIGRTLRAPLTGGKAVDTSGVLE